MPRFFLISLLVCLFGLARSGANAQTPADPKIVAEWTEQIVTEAAQEGGGGTQALERCAALDPDLQFAILQNVLPKIENTNAIAVLLNAIGSYEDATAPYEPGQVKRLADRINPHFLEILHLGMADKREEVQGTALVILNRDFGLKLTLKTYPDWYAKNGKRPVSAVLRDGMTDLVTRLKTEKEGMRTYLLDRLRDLPFTSRTWLLREPEGKGLVAMRLTALRRQAAIDAGLLDAIAAILRGGAMEHPDPNDKTTPGISPITRRKSLAFLSEFKPDADYLAKVAPDIQREFAARIGRPNALQGISPGLLLACPGDWTLPLLNRWIEADYANSEFIGALLAPVSSHDFHILPPLFALMKNPELEEAGQILQALMTWTELQGPLDVTPQAWLAWWEAKPPTVPAEVFRQPLPRFPSLLESLTKRLTTNKFFDRRTVRQFGMFDPDTQFTFLRDRWMQIPSEQTRFSLLDAVVRNPKPTDSDNPENFGLNPKALELFDLGVHDASKRGASAVLNMVGATLGWTFRSVDEYAAWRPAQTGKTNAAIFRDGCKNLARKLDGTDAVAARGAAYAALLLCRNRTTPRDRSTPERRAQSEKIAQWRKQMLLDSGVTLQMVALLPRTQDAAVRRQIIAYLRITRPDSATLKPAEDAIRKMVETELARSDGFSPEVLIGLSLYDSPWTTDTLLACLQKRYTDGTANYLIPLLQTRQDPRLIPSLISLLDIADQAEWQYAQLNAILRRIAKLPDAEPKDAHWWVVWWEQHKTTHPAAVRALPYPRIGLGVAPPRTFSIMQQARLTPLTEKPAGGYWRIDSGYLVTLPPPAATAAYVPGRGIGELAETQKPGLLVVLAKDWEDAEKQRDFWMNFDRSAFKGRYVIALVVPPLPRSRKPLWPLHAESGEHPRATTQALVSATVRDMEAAFPLSKMRRYCIGIGEGGMAALACVLAPGSGFRGAITDNAPFRSADLPPLSNAKGRRIALLHDKSSHSLPEFVRVAAQQTLTKAGAILRASDYDSKAIPRPAAPFETLESAIVWLEANPRSSP